MVLLSLHVKTNKDKADNAQIIQLFSKGKLLLSINKLHVVPDAFAGEIISII